MARLSLLRGWRGATVALCVLLAACRPAHEQPVSAPTPKKHVEGIVGINLFSPLDYPKCGVTSSGESPVPCWRTRYSASSDAQVSDGEYLLQLATTSVPEYTKPEIEVTVWNGVVHSISLETSMGLDRAVDLLSDKYGPVSLRERSDDGSPIVRWMDDEAEALIFANSPSYGEHWVLVQSRDLTAHKNAERRARSADGF